MVTATGDLQAMKFGISTELAQARGESSGAESSMY
jgi:hypothetical protein